MVNDGMTLLMMNVYTSLFVGFALFESHEKYVCLFSKYGLLKVICYKISQIHCLKSSATGNKIYFILSQLLLSKVS